MKVYFNRYKYIQISIYIKTG